MKIDKEGAEWLQYWLVVYLPVDSPAPVYMASGDEDLQHWQFVVDMIYMLFTVGIITVLPTDFLTKDDKFSCKGINGFCSALALQNPYKLDELDNPPAAWLSPTISITELGRSIVKKYFNPNHDNDKLPSINLSFVDHIEKLFQEKNLLQEFPLFQINVD